MVSSMQFNVSPEFIVKPYLAGVKLMSPPANGLISPHTTIGDVLKFPCNVYLLDTESCILAINDVSASTSGFQSVTDAIGSTVFDVLKRDSAQSITSIDKKVLESRMAKVNEDLMIRRDDNAMHFLTIKVPVYNEINHILGVFGVSVLLEEQPLAESINLMGKMGLLNAFTHYQTRMQINSKAIKNSHLSRRQQEIIQYLVRGYSAKKIGEHLGLSKRTIEYYIDLIKIKLSVSTKVELIEKIMQSDEN